MTFLNRIFALELGLLMMHSTAFAADPQAEIQSFIEKGDEELREITETNAREAVASYAEALKLDPQNYEANWKTSRAYNWILDLKTGGLIEEKDEYKPLLKGLGETAELYADRAYNAKPNGVEALAWYNLSYAYHASSMGIVTAILKGAGGKLKKLANEIIAVDDTYLDAVGYRLLGRLYFSAPFPVGSKKKALEYFQKSVERAPGSLFNHYWLGEGYIAREKIEEGRKEFQFVLDHPPTETEKHFSETTKQAAQRRLRELAEN